MNPTLRICLAFLLFGCLPLLAQQQQRSLLDRVLGGDTSVAGRSAMPSVLSGTAEDIHWDSRFGMPGANAEVRAITVAGDWVYVGGEFTFIGNIYANHIARWNRRTHQWQRLGQGVYNGVVDGVVLAIAVKGDSVIVGGQFLSVGGIYAANIAIWSQQSGNWSAVGQGGSGDIYAYVSAIVVKGKGFYVGGRFSAMGTLIANNVAQWDGERWRRLGAGVDQPVYAMALQGDDLCIGGEFTTANGADANRVARWDGTTWHTMGEGFDGTVNAMAVMNDTLYAGGTFSRSGGEELHLVAWWDAVQSRWRKFNSEESMPLFRSNHVSAFAVHGDSLFIGGNFLVSGGMNLVIWSNGGWHPLQSRDGMDHVLLTLSPGGGVDPTHIYALVTDGEQVYTGGTFTVTSGQGVSHPAQYLAAWSTAKQRWVAIGSGVNDGVNALLAGSDGIYVGGVFISAGGMGISNIARWDGSGWHPLDDGLNPVTYSGLSSVSGGWVNMLATDGKTIYAAGGFGYRGDTSETDSWRNISNVAAWDGLRWNHMPVGKTMGEAPSAEQVTSIVSFRGTLYAGRNNYGLMRWADTAWTTMGFPPLPTGRIMTLVNDRDRHIYAGTGNGIYRWDGIADAWTKLGGTDFAVVTIVVDGTRLFAGGYFTEIDSIRYNHIAMYDIVSGSWSALGSGVDRFDPRQPPWVQSLAMSEDGLLYVGGLFSTAGGVLVNNIATWDGEVWRPLGSGTDNVVNAIAIDGDDIYLGGAFRNVGGNIPSWFFAHWNATGIAAAPMSKHEQERLTLRAEPNPAGESLQVRYSIPADGAISISMYDMLGREVAQVLDGRVTAGTHNVMFSTAALPAGIYYCRLQGMGVAMTAQLVVMH
jgi:hypothetical protein